jgi:hypothetical protein
MFIMSGSERIVKRLSRIGMSCPLAMLKNKSLLPKKQNGKLYLDEVRGWQPNWKPN